MLLPLRALNTYTLCHNIAKGMVIKLKKFPFLIILAASFVVVVFCGFALMPGARGSFLPDSYISQMFMGISDGSLLSPTPQATDSQPVFIPSVEPSSTPVPTPVQTPAASALTPPSSPPSEPPVVPPTQVVETPPPSSKPDVPPPVAPVEQKFVQVDENYFSDALFVGDSRMVGMGEYSGLKASCYAYVGLTVYNLLDKAFISLDGSSKTVTLDYALQQKQFGKIYIMVGINEMGTGSPQRFIDTYTAAVQRIRELQPNAVIFVQGILYVTASRSETDEVFSNDKIRMRNAALAGLADGKRCFYIDVNEILSDGNGNLNKDYSWDTCHLKAQYYYLWAEFLMRHGVAPISAGS